MDQLVALHRITADRGGRLASSGARRRTALAVALSAVVAGFWIGSAWAGAAPSGIEADLVRLLRLMAVLKLATAAGAAWLVDWRLRAPAAPRLALGYPASVALMAAAPGLIWHLAPVIAGALAFHAGLILMLVLAYADRDALGTMRGRTGAA